MRIPTVGDMIRWRIDQEVFVIVEQTGSAIYETFSADHTTYTEYRFNAFSLTGRYVEHIVYNELNSPNWEYLNDP